MKPRALEAGRYAGKEMAKHQYRRRSPFLLLKRLARYELEDVDRLVTWSEQQRQARTQFLARLTPSVEDQFVDDVAEIDAFAQLYAECAIVALWRCVELFRKRVIAQAVGPAEADASFRHKEFCRMLKQLGIPESTLRCANSVNELRCLNNTVKHEGYVGDLRPHYVRLRPLAESYMDDLTKRATEWWGSKPA